MEAEGVNYVPVIIKTKGAEVTGNINIKYSANLQEFLEDKDNEKRLKISEENGVFEFLNVKKIKYIQVEDEKIPVKLHEVIIRFDDGEELQCFIELDPHYNRISDQLKETKTKFIKIYEKNSTFFVSFINDGPFESIRHIWWQEEKKENPRFAGVLHYY